MKLNVFGHLDLSPSISSRTLKILENRLLRSLQHVHKNSLMKEIRKIFPQLKRYLVLKLVYKFLLPCFICIFRVVKNSWQYLCDLMIWPTWNLVWDFWTPYPTLISMSSLLLGKTCKSSEVADYILLVSDNQQSNLSCMSWKSWS